MNDAFVMLGVAGDEPQISTECDAGDHGIDASDGSACPHEFAVDFAGDYRGLAIQWEDFFGGKRHENRLKSRESANLL
jgi:hypothetical protein